MRNPKSCPADPRAPLAYPKQGNDTANKGKVRDTFGSVSRITVELRV